MKVKEFFNPDWNKIIIFAIIFVLECYIGLSIVRDMGPKSYFWIEYGYPLVYLREGLNGQFHIFNLATDLIVFSVLAYLSSCIIVYAWNKFKGAKK